MTLAFSAFRSSPGYASCLAMHLEGAGAAQSWHCLEHYLTADSCPTYSLPCEKHVRHAAWCLTWLYTSIMADDRLAGVMDMPCCMFCTESRTGRRCKHEGAVVCMQRVAHRQHRLLHPPSQAPACSSPASSVSFPKKVMKAIVHVLPKQTMPVTAPRHTRPL